MRVCPPPTRARPPLTGFIGGVRSVRWPNAVDARGNITLHGRSTLRVLVRRYEGADPVDITDWPVFLEIRGILRKALDPAPSHLGHRILTLTSLEVPLLPEAPTPFVVRSEAIGAEPVVRWEGMIKPRGYIL